MNLWLRVWELGFFVVSMFLERFESMVLFLEVCFFLMEGKRNWCKGN